MHRDLSEGCEKKMIIARGVFPAKKRGLRRKGGGKEWACLIVLQYNNLEGSVDNPESTMLLVILKAAAKIFVLITSPTGWLHSCCVNNAASV